VTGVAARFFVTNPQKEGSHVAYDVRGLDAVGEIDVKRRYSEFDALHQQLTTRWPGMIIPTLPAKTYSMHKQDLNMMTGNNKHDPFIAERRYYLERFIRKISERSFMLNGLECQLFFRGDAKTLKDAIMKMPQLSTQEKFERMVEATGINIEDYENSMEKQRLDKAIIEYQGFVKKVEPLIKTIGKEI